MRKTISIAAAAGLALALVSGPPTASAATATLLGAPQPGTLASIGGAPGYAVANGLPSAAGQVATKYNNQVTTTFNGPSATVAVKAGSTNLAVGSVVGEATGVETLNITGVKASFKDAAPPFFTVKDIAALMPNLTFEFVLRSKSNGAIQFKGHYAINFANGKVSVDDAGTNSPPNGHPVMKQVNDGSLNLQLVAGNNQVVNSRMDLALTSCAEPGAVTFNSGIATMYTSYAAAVPFKLSAQVPFSFGFNLNQLTNGQQATLDLGQIGVANQPSWWKGISAGTKANATTGFGSFDWKSLFTTATVDALGPSVQQAFTTAFGKGLDIQQLTNEIAGRTDAQMAKDIDPMVTQFIASLAKALPKINGTIQDIPLYPGWYGELQMDNITGNTSWKADIHEPAKAMYPNLKADTTAKVVAAVKSKVTTSAWSSLALAQMGSKPATATITSTFAPKAITSLMATNISVDGVGPTAGPTTDPVVVPGSVKLGTSTWALESDGRAAAQVTVTSDGAWQATKDSPWLRVVRTSGRASATIKIVVARNRGPAREGHVTVQSGTESATLTVSQPAPITLSVSPRGVWRATGAELPRSFTVDTNAPSGWEAAPNRDWIHVQQGGATLQLTLDANTGARRSGAVQVKAGGRTVMIRIVQARG